MDNQEERLSLESVPVHHLPAEIDDYENLYFPINHFQVRDILGKVLTHIEAMNLPSHVEKANKAIFTQMVWQWFDRVMENSVTSSQGCIAPIKLSHCICDGITGKCNQCTAKEPIKVFHFVPSPEPLGEKIPGKLAK